MQVQSTVNTPIFLFIGSDNWNCWDTPVPGDAWGFVLPSQPVNANMSQKRGHGCDTNDALFSLHAVCAWGELTMWFTVPPYGYNMQMAPPTWTPIDPAHTLTATFENDGVTISGG